MNYVREHTSVMELLHHALPVTDDRERLESILLQLPSGVIIAEAETGRVLVANMQVERILRGPLFKAASLAEYAEYQGLHADGRPYEVHEWPLVRAVATGERVRGEEISIIRPDHSRAIVVVNASPILDAHGRCIAAVATIHDISKRKSDAMRHQILFEATTALSSSVDTAATLHQVGRLLVPRLACLCVVDVVDENGLYQRAVIVDVDPKREALLREWEDRSPSRFTGTIGPARVVRSERPERFNLYGDLSLHVALEDVAHVAALRRLGIRSYIAAPFLVRGQSLGAIALASTEPDFAYDDDDLRFLQQLSQRAADAIDNARLYEAEYRARQTAERTTERISRLQLLTATLAGLLSREEVSDFVVRQSVTALGAVAGAISLPVATANHGAIIASIGYQSRSSLPDLACPFDIAGPYDDVMASADPIVLGLRDEIASRYPQLASQLPPATDQGIVVVPLMLDQDAVGAMCLSFVSDQPVDGGDVAFLLAVGRQGGQALERARLSEAEREARKKARTAEQLAHREAARLAILAQSSQVLAASAFSEAPALEAVARLTANQTGDGCLIRLIADDGQRIEVATGHHPDSRLCEPFATIAQRPYADDLFSALVMRTGQPWCVPELGAASDAPLSDDALPTLSISALLVVPLRARERVIGTLSFVRTTEAGHYTAEDLSFAQDLADRIALTVDNARLYRAAQMAIHDRDVFLSIAAHELRTPITSLKGFAQLLMRDQSGTSGVSPRSRRFLQAIDDSSDRLQLLADDLLDVSRIRLGELPLRIQPIDLVQQARTIVSQTKSRIGDHHRLRLEIRGEPGSVEADPDRTEQILLNLLSNAEKFSPTESLITIVVAAKDDGVQVSVRDRGIGIPSHSTESIFKPFHRAENAIGAQVPGLGLGLYVCRCVAERHGGRIWAESAGEGRGTTISVWLPQKAAEEPRQSIQSLLS